MVSTNVGKKPGSFLCYPPSLVVYLFGCPTVGSPEVPERSRRGELPDDTIGNSCSGMPWLDDESPLPRSMVEGLPPRIAAAPLDRLEVGTTPE